MRAARSLPQVAQVQLLAFADLQISLNTCRENSGIQLHCGPLNRIAVELHKQRAELIHCLQDLDAIIVRAMPLGSLEHVIFRMDCLHAMESAGLAVINPPKSLEIAIDKWLTLHRLHLSGVPTPPTIVCQTRDSALAAFEQLGGDVLVKPIFGGEGRGILRVNDPDTAWRVFGTLQQIGQVHYVQQFLDHFGYDIRILVVGSKLYSIKRFGQQGHWRTNLSQGGFAESHVLTDQERDLALASANAIGGSLLGIDLLPLRDGRLVVLEVNAVPGWKGLAQALQVDIASEVLAHIVEMTRLQHAK
jgi:RimK family alpha-L-glutamate ligase